MERTLLDEHFAAFVEIDWADAKHDVCLQVGAVGKRESSTLRHTPEAIEGWANALRRRCDGQVWSVAHSTRTPGPDGIYIFRDEPRGCS